MPARSVLRSRCGPLTLFALLVAFLVPELAQAATRTIRGRINFHNARYHYSTGEGSLLRTMGNDSGPDAQMSYVEYRVHARCGSTTYKSALEHASKSGWFSHTFTNICSNPEFKMGVRFRSKPGNWVFHDMEKPDGTVYSTWIPAVGYMSTNSSEFVNNRLTRSLNVSCRATWDGSCDTPDTGKSHKLANLYKSAIDVYERWGYLKHDVYDEVTILYPDPEDSSGANRDEIHIAEDHWDRNHGTAHEFGHLYHRRAMDVGNGSLSNPTWCEGHSWHWTKSLGTNNDHSETCATSEGWADFFAAATYFEPSARRPYYKFCGDECDDGAAPVCDCETEATAPQCRRQCRYNDDKGEHQLTKQILDGRTWNRAWTPELDASGRPRRYACVRDPAVGKSVIPEAVEGNTARFFWDLYDTRGTEGISASRTTMRLVWDVFPAGFNNRQKDEPRRSSSSGDYDDADGRNAWDYTFHWLNKSEQDEVKRLLELNCLGDQEEGF
ncbi:MAG: hypothetical protein AAF799_46945 [Myxococcota bacterium]